ncbi:4'-phosphopantetheinyl transferase family protein [Telluribacter sp.]|jgi:phosphopantetheinyl transferase|uniref:4'-phosphopantetheinyl transferase family protein n=1 Tax=Telluribacter sp. TaxID=1978767 RepID=UPI002E15C62F|nr:4'-phosphopantetheinyl transferase superfamily protein [Telluribacter sp.]
MPLHYSETLAGDCRILLWKLEENEDSLRALLPVTDDHTELATITHPQKRREWLAGRVLIKTLAEQQLTTSYKGMWKDEHGKPFLVDSTCPISITHTVDYVAGVLHEHRPVGIDMEKIHPKLIRTAPKYLSEAELAHAGEDVAKLCIYWCAKEALYKLHGRKKVSFKDAIAIESFEVTSTTLYGTLTEADLRVSARVHIRWVKDYCLAVAL